MIEKGADHKGRPLNLTIELYQLVIDSLIDNQIN